MQIKCGIVGLPNVGKSTLFNAILSHSVKTENYPFCTIEPNLGSIEIRDEKLIKAASIIGSKKTTFANLEIVDIAGLVKDAHKGEGLGNQFLSHVREVNAIIHLVRCFNDPEIIHVYDNVDPKRDIEIINTEILLADLEIVEKRLEKEKKAARVGDKKALERITILEKIRTQLGKGTAIRQLDVEYQGLQLISLKPVIYFANFKSGQAKDYLDIVKEIADKEKCSFLAFDCALASELNALKEEEKLEYMEEFGIKEPLLKAITDKLCEVLNLIVFYTINDNEARAWLIKKGTNALKAAGMVHSDFEKGFIKAECYNIDELLETGNEIKLRELGHLRQEGRDYQIKNSEVVFFITNL